MLMSILSVSNLSKAYGSIRALKQVSFEVEKGTVFGILGPNGSGKTTLLGTVTDILRQDEGSYQLFDQPTSALLRRKIGTLLETPNFYHYLSAVQNLVIAAKIKGRGTEDIERVLKMVNLWNRRNSRFSTFSLGMKQRLAIASAMMGNPEVLIFDEPTNGLDPTGIAEIRSLIKELNQQGQTIIMASHLLDEVEKVCTHVAILKSGNLLTSGHVNEILAQEDLVEIGAKDMEKLEAVLEYLPGHTSVEKLQHILRLYFPVGEADLAAVNDYCHSKGVTLNHLVLKKKSLEAKFLELTNNK